jgi:hypothetical protein
MRPIKSVDENMLLLYEFPATANPGKLTRGVYVTKTTTRLFLSIAIFSTSFIFQTARAEHTPVPPSITALITVQLPAVDREALIEDVEALRSQLIARKQALAQNIKDRKLDSSDALITALMPGGLLYIGYKKIRYEQAREELARVSAEIEEYSDDLVAMQAMSTKVVVAQLP